MRAETEVISAYCPTEKPWGGANNFLRALLPALAKHGIRVRYLKDEPENNPPPADILFFNQLGAGPDGGGKLYSMEEIEKIRGRYPAAKMAVRAINLRRHARFNARLPYWLSFADRARDRAVKRQMEMSDFIIFQSRYQKGIFEQYGCPVKDHVVVHNGAPLLFAEEGSRAPRIAVDPSRPLKLMSTSVSGNPRKRLGLVARLSEWPGVEITHAGSWPGKIPQGKVRMAGTLGHDSICALMKESDYYLMLSEGEMCPNGLIEALAFGLPAIYSPEGGGAAEVGEGYGVAFDENNMDAVILQARERHSEFADKAAADREKFLVTHAAAAYAEVFKKLAGCA